MDVASLVAAFGAVVFAAFAWIEARRSRKQAVLASHAAERAALAAERSAGSDEASVLIEQERLERERRDDLAAGSPRLEISSCLFNAERREFLIITRNVGAHAGLVQAVELMGGQGHVQVDRPLPPLAVLPGERQSMGVVSDEFDPADELVLKIYFSTPTSDVRWRLTAALVRDGVDRTGGWPQWRTREASTVRLSGT